MDSVLLKQVSKTYRLDAIGVPALTDINLEIRSGRFTVISGASGSGKTTLLNLIGCIDKPDGGEIVVAGQPVQRLSDDALSDFRARQRHAMERRRRGRTGVVSDLTQQVGGFDVQRHGQAPEQRQRRVGGAALDQRDIGAVGARCFRQRDLRIARLFPAAFEVVGEPPAFLDQLLLYQSFFHDEVLTMDPDAAMPHMITGWLE